jgi:hypothetical protein
MNNTVLLFKTFGPIAKMASVHAATCNMVNTAKGKRSVKMCDADPETLADLAERGYPVTFCKCCR